MPPDLVDEALEETFPASDPSATTATTGSVVGRRPQPLLRVLVVDDNEDAANALAMWLGRFTCAVDVAFDGESALSAAEHAEPHVGILDLGLPRIDGFELARRIRQRPWGTRTMLIALSGWGQEEHRIRSREAGFDLHLVKPADSQTLLSILDAVRRELPPESCV